MATDTTIGPAPRSYSDSDTALFDSTAVPLHGDVRTVGEMLQDVDFLARRLLFDVTGDEAAQLIRGWPGVVAAADQLWDAMPRRSSAAVDLLRNAISRSGSAAAAEPGSQAMDRLRAVTDGMAQSLETARWPADVGQDDRLAQIAATLGRAAVLVQRYGHEVDMSRPHARRDLDAAQTRIMHSLYASAHAIGVALHQRRRDHGDDAAAAGEPDRQGRRPDGLQGWLQRIARCETIAGDYVHGRYPQALTGEAAPAMDDPTRLQRALVTWDIQAHRTLARDPAPAHLVQAIHTQEVICATAVVLIDAADRAGTLPSPSSVDRLLPTIEHAGRAWSSLASRWADLVPPGARRDPALGRAAGEVRAACRELSHDKNTLASPDTIASRPGLPRAVTALLESLEAAPELAQVVGEHAKNPDLTGPARALSRRAHNDVEAAAALSPDTDTDVVWVSPRDVLANRLVPLPRPVADGLRSASDSALAACAAAAAPAALMSGPSGTASPQRGLQGRRPPAPLPAISAPAPPAR